MYVGEYESLKAIYDTKTIPVPKPIAIGQTQYFLHYFIVMEYKNATAINAPQAAELGRKLADLHMYNLQPHGSLVPMRYLEFFSSQLDYLVPKDMAQSDLFKNNSNLSVLISECTAIATITTRYSYLTIIYPKYIFFFCWF